MKAYFNRNTPFYLMSAEEIGDSESFDAYPVEVEEQALIVAQALRAVVVEMQEIFVNNPAPEECAQLEANEFIERLKALGNGAV